jgi:hypothetical protein
VAAGEAGSGRPGEELTEKLLATIALLTGRVDALQEALLTQQQGRGQGQGPASASSAAPAALRGGNKDKWMEDSGDAPTWAEWARTEMQLATAGLVVVAVLLVVVKALLVVLTYVRGA